LTRLKDAKNNTVIADNNYTYNTAGAITQNIDQGGTHAYGYDSLDRLTSATYTGTPAESYAYDSVGNRTSSQRSATYGYQPFNRLTNTSTASYLYDNNGNLTTKTEGAGTTHFAWDFENRLIQVVTPAAGSVTYKYDALGRRIQSAPSNGASTNFTYDGQDVAQDKTSTNVITEYLNAPGIDNKIRQKTGTTLYYFAKDHLGSTAALTDSKGALVERETYDAYGNSAGSAKTRFGYTGRERDSLTGLMYYRARFYDPQLGRFISEDPVRFSGGSNWYAYVNNNPVNFSDPTGLWVPAAHNEIIDQAFKGCLDNSQRQALKDASAWVDRSDNWGEDTAYQHGMRGPDESVNDARDAANKFISDHEQAARNGYPKGCKDGYGKIPSSALREFGIALHTLTDMTSPAHEGFQIWHDFPEPGGDPIVNHIRNEIWGIRSANHIRKETRGALLADPGRLQRIKKMARDEFGKIFGDCGCCTD
jgi:RHS repeat-associated protein